MLFAGDRELVAAWVAEGIVPDDHSTREYAAQLCGRLLEDLDEWQRIANDLLERA